MPLFDFWRDEITVVTSYAASGPDIIESIALIRSRQVRVADMITHRLFFGPGGSGFELPIEGARSTRILAAGGFRLQVAGATRVE